MTWLPSDPGIFPSAAIVLLGICSDPISFEMICQVDTIDFLREPQSLRKPPHAFGSELVRKSEAEKAC